MTAAVVLREGPASERAWLGLRLALALGLGGHRVTVVLLDGAAGWAVPVDARPWIGGDPARDLAGLVEDAGAAVVVDRGALRAAGLSPELCLPAVQAVDRDVVTRSLLDATLVVPV